ncbi:MAG TPA: CHAT domain-containing protein, partial [Thermoanaerobaculia bacterium]|nr:CHAT domain-containing protein [Thermoanaerobaculia bacterium]
MLQFDASSRGGFRARVLKSPFGEGVVGFSLSSTAGAEPAYHDASGVSRDIGHQEAASAPGARPPLDIGTELYRSVFQGQVRTLLDKSRGRLEMSPDLGLRLKIKIDPNDEETGALADLPWELLCDGETEDFFALSRQTSVVRYLDVPRSSQPIPFTPPLRILAVSASPRGMQPLDIAEEVRNLKDLNQSSAGVKVEFLEHISAGALREALSGDTYNVLHFMGHGTFDRASGEGMLAFEGPGGAQDLVSGRAFATKLRDLRSLGVVVLNACDTARARHQAGANPFRGVATALVLGGVPAVVAMQRPISDRAALGFSAAFYRHLARGDSIDEALTEGRQAIHSAKPESFEWATPVLFLRMPDGNVFVAKPAAPPEKVEALQPAPTLPQIVSPTRGPAASGRGLALKIAAGAASAGLVFVLYTQIPKREATLPGNQTTGETSDFLTSEIAPGIEPEPEPTDSKKAARNQPADEAQERQPSVSTPQGSTEENKSLPVSVDPPPAPITSPSTGAAETVTATADLSKLSAKLLSVVRRKNGLRAEVRFTNTAALPLSVVIDKSSSTLSGYPTGGGSQILDCSSCSLRLDAGASATHTFDFSTPKLGLETFNLSLSTEEGLIDVE